MIDFAKCQTCYPIVAKIIEVKFEAEKALRQCIVRSWKECDKDATVHVVDYVDPTRPGTRFVLHRCAEHATLQPKPEVKQEIAEDCFGGTS